jgi:hypothetical protein
MRQDRVLGLVKHAHCHRLRPSENARGILQECFDNRSSMAVFHAAALVSSG